MKLPSDLKGYHKIRDAQIINLFREDHKSIQEIAEIVKLTDRRVSQILRANKVFLRPDPEWEKLKRLGRLQRVIKREDKNGLETDKDFVDLQRELRTEIEGDKPLVEQHTHITYVYDGISEEDQIAIQTARLPNPYPRIQK